MSEHDDLLARATRSLRDGLRDEKAGDSPDAARTRARILLLASRERRRTKRIVWMAPMAAALAASSAWAAVHGVVPKVWHEVGVLFVRAPAEDHAPVHDRSSARRGVEEKPGTGTATDAGASPVPEVAFDTLPVAAVPVESLPREAPRTGMPTPSTAPSSSPPASSIAERPSDEEASRLYALAHEAHFVGHDPQVALAAWDAYLHAAPQGALAPEARYNRALTLIRLGRTDQAREALAPFARGEVGGYRQGEARALLDALDGR